MSDDSSILWSPDPARVATANLTRFAKQFSARIGVDFEHDHPTPTESYRRLHQASIDHAAEFWRELWSFTSAPGSLGEIDYQTGATIREGVWFPQGQVNFAEALLLPDRLSDSSFAGATAIIARDETGTETTWTRQELFDEVRSLASYLHSVGIKSGERICAVVPNIGEAVIGMLAAASLGAVWSSCSPEFGDDAICDRFGQIEPKLILTTATALYNHKTIRPLDRVLSLLHRLPSLQQVLVVGELSESAKSNCSGVALVSWSEVVHANRVTATNANQQTAGDFEAWFLKRRAFNHPLYIVYSSGTTGIPKCIVHGAGGSLIQHLKEHQLHCDLQPGDRLFYYTTTGWMMWNWLVSGLASQATIILQDGSPFAAGPSTLWTMAEQTTVTHFGAGARFYATVEKEQYSPAKHHDLSKLRCIMSTGSPLLETSFDWIYREVSEEVNLASISGGTDILSCFVLGNQTLPVRRGEIQCKGLGMDVRVVDESGKPIIDQPGELICAAPFPSMPTGFWNDPDGEKYRRAYFDRYENVWCHGDWSRETPSGGLVIYGRSDATLNPSGVRIGTAEIYQQIESFPEVVESLATVLRSDGDEQIVLFVRMAPGYELSRELASTMRQRIRSRCSPRHVPVYIAAAPDLPRTISGKLSEIAVRNAISGTTLGNAGALANPESLRFFESWSPTTAL